MIISFIVKSICCMLFFWIIYHFLLEKESMLKFKRYFLLAVLVFSILIPFISTPNTLKFTSSIDEIAERYISKPSMRQSSPDAPISEAEDFSDEINLKENRLQSINDTPSEPGNMWGRIIIGIYMLVTSLLLIRFIYNLSCLLKLTQKGIAIKYGQSNLIIIEELKSSFSFFNYIFISKSDYQDNSLKNKILIHELIHVKQKHSADVLFIELLITFFWFNPVLYLYRRTIKLNHEFLADKGVIDNTKDISAYQMILINKASNRCNFSFTSSLTYSITKKRLIMMTKTTSRSCYLFKIAALIPTFLIAGNVFSTEIVTEDAIEPISAFVTNEQLPSNMDTIIIPESGVSQAEMEQYSNIVSKYFDKITEDGKFIWKSKEISKDDLKTLFPLYIRMTKEQRKLHYIHIISPLNPWKLRSPNVDEWRGCTNDKNKRIFLDGKEIDGEKIKDYSRRSIVYFCVAKESLINDESERTSYLWTKEGYDEYIRKYGKQISLSQLFSVHPQTWFRMATKK